MLILLKQRKGKNVEHLSLGTDPTKYINANGEFAIHTRLYITVGKNYIVVRADKKSVRKSDPVFDNKKYKLVKR